MIDDEILMSVDKPARYIGKEVNSIVKNKDEIALQNLLKLAVNIANSDNNYRTLVLKKPKHTKEIVATQDVASEEFIFAPQETFAAIKSSHKK